VVVDREVFVYLTPGEDNVPESLLVPGFTGTRRMRVWPRCLIARWSKRDDEPWKLFGVSLHVDTRHGTSTSVRVETYRELHSNYLGRVVVAGEPALWVYDLLLSHGPAEEWEMK
jgi:hypothetical protein